MIEAICGEIRNYFEVAKYKGEVSVVDGVLPQEISLQDGQCYRIIGSVFNDGVHQYPYGVLTDETFVGEVWAMAIPPALIALADEIKAYNESDLAKPTAYTSESFGGYSYSREGSNDWQSVFGRKLNRWRKI